MPWCPKCGYEYRPEIETCPDCGVALVLEAPQTPETALPQPRGWLAGPAEAFIVFWLCLFNYASLFPAAYVQSLSPQKLPLRPDLMVFAAFSTTLAFGIGHLWCHRFRIVSAVAGWAAFALVCSLIAALNCSLGYGRVAGAVVLWTVVPGSWVTAGVFGVAFRKTRSRVFALLAVACAVALWLAILIPLRAEAGLDPG